MALPSQSSDDGTRRVLRLLASKWTIPVVRCLAAGSQRPSELLERLDGVSQKVLIQTLRRLESGSLIVRQVHATVSRRVDYQLTPQGETLLQLLGLLARWLHKHETLTTLPKRAPSAVRPRRKTSSG